jgi:hypothetical protein
MSALKRRDSVEYEIKWHTGKLFYFLYTIAIFSNIAILCSFFLSCFGTIRFSNLLFPALFAFLYPSTTTIHAPTKAFTTLHNSSFVVLCSAEKLPASSYRIFLCIAGFVYYTTKLFCFFSGNAVPPFGVPYSRLRICILSSIRFPLEIWRTEKCMYRMSGLTFYPNFTPFLPLRIPKDVLAVSFGSGVHQCSYCSDLSQTFSACLPTDTQTNQ